MHLVSYSVRFVSTVLCELLAHQFAGTASSGPRHGSITAELLGAHQVVLLSLGVYNVYSPPQKKKKVQKCIWGQQLKRLALIEQTLLQLNINVANEFKATNII